jgi:hypothetical protein
MYLVDWDGKRKAGAVGPFGLAFRFVLSGRSIHTKEPAGFCGADVLPIKIDCLAERRRRVFSVDGRTIYARRLALVPGALRRSH